MSTQIQDHILNSDQVGFKASPNRGGRFAEGQPDTIVLHYTGGRSFESSADWLRNPESNVSAHIIIGRDGEILQMVPFDTIAWHAGISEWKGRTGLNGYSIGIELDNTGQLERRAKGFYTWFGTPVDDARVSFLTHRNEQEPAYWEAYTPIQIRLAEEICRQLIAMYNIKEILGHEEISPGRKDDPGPAFPLDTIRNKLLYPVMNGKAAKNGHHSQKHSKGLVMADYLNIRREPSMKAYTVSNPLPRGTKVKILEEQDGWLRVKVNMEGWVSKDYISD